ncbi:hypothetical protein BJ166DRAFT_519416 [Pestalotiopsis sp. NC0098]|nr:hypothetical protein BJ166DRAFT_519416 [Pestalotiopsis sp. NC0098]
MSRFIGLSRELLLSCSFPLAGINSSIDKQSTNFDNVVEWHMDPSVTVNMTKYVEVMKKFMGIENQPKEVWYADEWSMHVHN